MKQHHCTRTVVLPGRHKASLRTARRQDAAQKPPSLQICPQRLSTPPSASPRCTASRFVWPRHRLYETKTRSSQTNSCQMFFSSFTRALGFSHLEELKPAGRSQQGGVQRDNTIPGHLPLRGRHLPVELERPHHHIGHWRNHHQVKTSCTRGAW